MQKKKISSKSKGQKPPLKKKSLQLATDFTPAEDPAHEAGHKKINLKQTQNSLAKKNFKAKKSSVGNRLSPADDIQSKESPQRQIQFPIKK